MKGASNSVPSPVDGRFYDELVADFAPGWDADDRLIADPAVREAGRALLEREARLLDARRYDEWLSLYADDCAVWVPGTWPAGDPRREITVFLDDRRRLEDRIFRLRSGHAWSQAPASRTTRMVSNVEAFRGRGTMLRCNFLLTEFRAGEVRSLAGWAGYRLDGGRIAAKQLNLLEADQALRNPSVLL